MARKKTNAEREESPFSATESSRVSRFLVFRETIESIVVAFVLAFLFRTFEAEAFVIPTGSMSPSLQGRHKDVNCMECGCRFRTTASTEDPEEAARRGPIHDMQGLEVVGGMCPMCRFPMPFTRDLPDEVLGEIDQFADLDEIELKVSYPGDRILVNKYGFDFGDPQRWDVVVFKFPGDGNMNYIKRLVALPGEQLRIYQGDVFTRPARSDEPYVIQRKPPEKVAATLQRVHDTDYESATLYKAGWPLRWAATTPEGWQEQITEPKPGDRTVRQRFDVDLPADAPTAWMRYRHHVADHTDDWIAVQTINRTGSLAELADREGVSEDEFRRAWNEHLRPQLITDFNAYNAQLRREHVNAGAAWGLEGHLGFNWVGDLAVECEVEVAEARGELLLDLVEAGYHFRVTIDLTNGQARAEIVDGRSGERLSFDASGDTPLKAPGQYTVRFANVDDQLVLWVDDEAVRLKGGVYEPETLFQPGGRRGMIPWASEDLADDHGDLAPAGVGARGARLKVSRLALLRDIYYIATNDRYGFEEMHMDYDSGRRPTSADGRTIPALNTPRDLFALQETWSRFLTRRSVEFTLGKDQFFVMGDNSPESADCRVWVSNPPDRGVPGGPYLDRELLIGKAICVFWPHSWGNIPGLQKLPGWPNFQDMRLVR